MTAIDWDALREAWSDEGEREWLALEREAEDLIVFAECGERP